MPNFGGLTKEAIEETLASFQLDGGASGEIASYAREDCERFLYTIDLVPDRPIDLLEIGANPYFTSYLLRKFRPHARCKLVNYFGGEVHEASQEVRLTGFNGSDLETERFDYLNLNIEEHSLPYESASMDVVLYCEVIEHMINDPIRSVIELKRVLRPEGHLIMTTPNVARLENVARLLSGANLYDPYSGYGPYGRHNREYTRHEINRLLTFCGFEEEVFFTADVHPNYGEGYFQTERYASLIDFRSADLGQYLFTRWRNTGPAPIKKPNWLYRSYPDNELDTTPL